MTNQKLFSIFFIFSLLLLTSCGEDDDATITIPPSQVKTNFVIGEQGSHLAITMHGATTTCIGDKVIGWSEGNLLGQRRWKQLRMLCGDNYFTFRISMPKGTLFEDIAEREHSLFETRLLLEHSGDLDILYPEFFYNFEPKAEGNAAGTVEILRDVVVNGTTYSLVGNIDASFYIPGSSLTVKGQFWSENATW